MADFSYSNDPKLQELGALVTSNPEDFGTWQQLLEAVVRQEGGLSRNANPSAIAGARETFNRFLALYPLTQDAWCRYADLEFRIAGTEAAEYIFERAVGSCSSSVEIWTKYCEHTTTTTHDVRIIRELFDRAVDSIGHDFNADPIWDAYLLFERQHGDPAHAFAIYKRLIRIPLFHYARYYERFRAVSAEQPIEELADAEAIAQVHAQVQVELQAAGNPDADLASAVRVKIDLKYWEDFQRIQEDVNKRWTWEQHIGKDGGAKMESDEARIDLWRSYLAYEEQKGSYEGIKALYERCLTYNSTLLDFWFRYVRWLTAQSDKEEEVRNIYRRVSYIFAPIAEPAIRLLWAKFEEAYGRPSVAIDIHEAILIQLPNDLATNTSLTMLLRRQKGIDAAAQSVQDRIAEAQLLPSTRGALAVDWARLIWREQGDADAAREVFIKHQKTLTDCSVFWSGWLTFEINQPRQQGKQKASEHAKTIYQSIQQRANLATQESQELSTLYMRYLEECGNAGDMAEFVELDALVHGPASLRSTNESADTKTYTNGQASN